MNFDDRSSGKDFSKKEEEQIKKIKDAISDEYRHYKPDSEHKINELKQTESISEEITNIYKDKSKNSKKIYIICILSLIAIASVFVSYSFLGSDIYNDSVSHKGMTSQFLIQNLKGDTIDTWISWNVVEDDLFHVHVIDSKYATQERLDAIVDVIMSTEEIEIDDSLLHKGPSGQSSTYYAGWMGALNSISDETLSSIPKKLHFHVTDKGEGQILIELSNLSHPDGYSGYTKSIVDEAQHQILKSHIVIYDIEKISIEELKTILRHELGHGFGLAHSTDPDDLMHPTIITNYPYISECDLDAISLLYNGGKTSQVVCQK